MADTASVVNQRHASFARTSRTRSLVGRVAGFRAEPPGIVRIAHGRCAVVGGVIRALVSL